MRAVTTCVLAIIVASAPVLTAGCRNRDRAVRVPPRTRLSANTVCLRLNERGVKYCNRAQYDSALPLFREALRIAEDSSLHERAFASLQDIAIIFEHFGMPDSAQVYYDRAQTHGRASGKSWTLVSNLRERGVSALYNTRPESARALFRRAVKTGANTKPSDDMARACADLASMFVNAGRCDSALYWFEASLRTFSALGSRGDEAMVLQCIAYNWVRHPHAESGRAALNRVISLAQRDGLLAVFGGDLNDAGCVHAGEDDLAAARRCFGMARAVAQQAQAAELLRTVEANLKLLESEAAPDWATGMGRDTT